MDQSMEKLPLWLLFHKTLPIFKVDLPLINSQNSVGLQHSLVFIGDNQQNSISHGLKLRNQQLHEYKIILSIINYFS